MKILITNAKNCYHYEILESIIHKMNRPTNIIDVFYVDTKSMNYTEYFNRYIANNQIKRVNGYDIDKYDLVIFATIYDHNVPSILSLNQKQSPKFMFFAHEITPKLLKIPNVFFLTPLCGNKNYMYMDTLPFMNEYRKPDKVNILVQGELRRRDMVSLQKLLYVEGDYKVTLLGKSQKSQWLQKYINNGRVIMKSYQNFIDFHREILKCSHIITLTDPQKQSHYYKNKLTSTINYARAYGKNGMICLIDEGLQKIYQLENAIAYNKNNITKIIQDEINKR